MALTVLIVLLAMGGASHGYCEPHRPIYGRTVAAGRSRIGGEDFEAARAKGHAMTFEQTVEYVLNNDEASPSAP